MTETRIRINAAKITMHSTIIGPGPTPHFEFGVFGMMEKEDSVVVLTFMDVVVKGVRTVQELDESLADDKQSYSSLVLNTL